MTDTSGKNVKTILVTLVIVAVLCGLAYLQFRTWKQFNWQVFFAQTRQANPLRILFAIAIIYAGYFLRALRWRVMLRPVKQVSWKQLLSPMFIGFAGLAILGRPGEFIRPYLVARRERLTVSSQLAVWTVERILDMGCFAVIVAVDLIFAPSLRNLPYFHEFRRAGFVLVGVIVILSFITFLIWRNGEQIAALLARWLSPFSEALAQSVGEKTRTFGEGLHTIHDVGSFFELLALSFGLWLSIAYAYLQVTNAYPAPLRHMQFSHLILLMGFSVAGSAVQLPVVGGGSQLATIAALVHVFQVPDELAVSCGVLIWLVTFISAIPIGLGLARHAHLSLLKLSEEADVTTHPATSSPLS